MCQWKNKYIYICLLRVFLCDEVPLMTPCPGRYPQKKMSRTGELIVAWWMRWIVSLVTGLLWRINLCVIILNVSMTITAYAALQMRLVNMESAVCGTTVHNVYMG